MKNNWSMFQFMTFCKYFPIFKKASLHASASGTEPTILSKSLKREWNIWWGRVSIIKLKSPPLSRISRSLFRKQHRFTLFYINLGSAVPLGAEYICQVELHSLKHTRTHTIMANWEWKEVSRTRLILYLNIKIYMFQSTNKGVGKTVKLISANIFLKISS